MPPSLPTGIEVCVELISKLFTGVKYLVTRKRALGNGERKMKMGEG
jgi:hypothetical protein